MHDQASLFGAETSEGTVLVQVGVVGSRKSLSRAQKTFNRLIETIRKQRRSLVEWQEFGLSFTSRVASDWEPLEQRVAEQRRALLRCFDAAHDGGNLTRREQGKIARIICEDIAELLEGESDAELISLHDKYSDVSHDDLRQGEVEMLKAVTEAALGIAIDDDSIQTPEELMEAVRRQVEQDADRGAERGSGKTGTFDRRSGAAGAGHGGPASARAHARRERERAAIEGATRSVREVYRKLASALHPDREADPVERERKTALMQRVNQAYDAGDLLQLLSLQIEVEQIDLGHLATIGDDRLAHYNCVLREQSAELEQELLDLMAPFGIGAAGSMSRELTPATVLGAFQRDLAELRRESARLADQLEAFKDPRSLKAWLKAQRIERARSPEPVDAFEGLLAAMADDFEFVENPPRRGGGRRKRR